MSLSYLSKDDSATADKLNDLFRFADGVLGKMFGGKSPFYWEQSSVWAARGRIFYGQPTLFYGSPHPRLANDPDMPASYNNSAFVAAAAACSLTRVANRDTAYRILPTVTSGLHTSLQVLTKSVTDSDGAHDYYLVDYTGSALAPYNVKSINWATLQRRRPLTLCELVFENYGSGMTFPKAWDKYDFFRIHNLNTSGTFTLTFEDGPGIEVPAGECRCVRRVHAKDGTITWIVGGNYFNYAAPGDARALILPDWAPASRTLYSFMHQANNVVNPGILINWLDFFNGRMRLNPHEQWNPGTLYDGIVGAQSGGTVSGSASILDLLVHRGQLALVNQTTGVKTVFDYTGLASLSANGITVTAGTTTVGPKIQKTGYDLVMLGVNLFGERAAGKHWAAININTAQEIGVNTVKLFPWGKLARSVTAISLDRHAVQILYTGAGVFSSYSTITNNETMMRYTETRWPYKKLIPDQITVTEALTLSVVSAEANPDSGYVTFSSRAMYLGACGPVLAWTEKLSLSADASLTVDSANDGYLGDFVSVMTADGYRLDTADGLTRKAGTFLSETVTLNVDPTVYRSGFGWPCVVEGARVLPGCSCRMPRVYGAGLRWLELANVSGGTFVYFTSPDWKWINKGPAGAGAQAGWVNSYHYRDYGVRFNLSVQMRLSQWMPAMLGNTQFDAMALFPATASFDGPFDGTVLPVGWDQDPLREIVAHWDDNAYWVTRRGRITSNIAVTSETILANTLHFCRKLLTAEDYNVMAQWYRQIELARPYTHTDYAAIKQYIGGFYQFIEFPAPGGHGMFESSVYPADCYRIWRSGDFHEPVFNALAAAGLITIRTSADLPDLSGWLAEDNLVLKLDGSGGYVVTNNATGQKYCEQHTDETFPGASLGVMTPAAWLADMRWVTIADMKSAAIALGMPFNYQQLSVPLKLRRAGATLSTTTGFGPFPGVVIYRGVWWYLAQVTGGADWKVNAGSRPRLQDNDGDILVYDQVIDVVIDTPVAQEFYRWNPNCQPSANELFLSSISRAYLYQASSTRTPRTNIALIPQPKITWPSAYCATATFNQRSARINLGENSLPLSRVDPAGDTIIAAAVNGTYYTPPDTCAYDVVMVLEDDWES